MATNDFQPTMAVDFPDTVVGYEAGHPDSQQQNLAKEEMRTPVPDDIGINWGRVRRIALIVLIIVAAVIYGFGQMRQRDKVEPRSTSVSDNNCPERYEIGKGKEGNQVLFLTTLCQ